MNPTGSVPSGKVIEHRHARRHRRPVTTLIRGPLSEAYLELPIPEDHLKIFSMLQPDEADEFRTCVDRAGELFEIARNRLFPSLQQEGEDQPEPDPDDNDDENEHEQTGPRANPDQTLVGASHETPVENPDGKETPTGEIGSPGESDGPERVTDVIEEEEEEEETDPDLELNPSDDADDDAIAAAFAAALSAGSETD